MPKGEDSIGYSTTRQRKVEFEANYLRIMFLNNRGTCQELTQFINTNNQFGSQMIFNTFFNESPSTHQHEETIQTWLCRQMHCVQVALDKQTVSGPRHWHTGLGGRPAFLRLSSKAKGIPPWNLPWVWKNIIWASWASLECFDVSKSTRYSILTAKSSCSDYKVPILHKSIFWLYNNEYKEHIINWLMQLNCKVKSLLSSIWIVISLSVNHSRLHAKWFSFLLRCSLFYS